MPLYALVDQDAEIRTADGTVLPWKPVGPTLVRVVEIDGDRAVLSTAHVPEDIGCVAYASLRLDAFEMTLTTDTAGLWTVLTSPWESTFPDGTSVSALPGAVVRDGLLGTTTRTPVTPPDGVVGRAFAPSGERDDDEVAATPLRRARVGGLPVRSVGEELVYGEGLGRGLYAVHDACVDLVARGACSRTKRPSIPTSKSHGCLPAARCTSRTAPRSA